MPTITLPVAEFMPDMPDPGPGSANIRNVYPRSELSYGAIGSLATQYNALALRCQGAYGMYDSSGNVFIFAGDARDLYMLKAGLSAWQNVSKSAAAYSIPAEDMWHFTFFNGDVIANNWGGTPQYFRLTSSVDFADLGGSPPQGRYVAVVKNAFVVLANTYDGTNGNMPQRVWWSAAGNAHSWPTLGSSAAAQVQSSAVDLLGDGGWVKGIVSDLINADAVIFQEFAIKRMTYVGPPTVFSFLPVESGRGTSASNSIVGNGGVVYYWGHDGVYAFDGGESGSIGFDKVDKTLFPLGASNSDAVDPANLHRVIGTADPLNNMIWWLYPTKAATNGLPNRLLGYNWRLKRWSIADVTAEMLVRLLAIGYTLDDLYTVFGYTVDTIPAPLDSSVWSGGQLQFGAFDSSHKLGFLTGAPLEATVETSETQAVPGRRVLITNSRPYVDGVGTAPTVSIGHRERLQDAVTYSQAVALTDLGTCPVRTSGRYIRARTVVPAGSTTWENIGGVEVDAVAQGTR